MIQAPSDLVLRAYMIDIDPFNKGFVHRVLIDQWGLVYIPSYGWSNKQDFGYKFVVLPEPIKMYKSYDLWDFWYESKAWKDPAWAWCNYRKSENFVPCYVNSEGAIFVA